MGLVKKKLMLFIVYHRNYFIIGGTLLQKEFKFSATI